MELFVNSKFDFVRWRFHALALSLIVVAIGGILFFTRGLNVGIDFAGGATVVLRFQEEPPVAELRASVDNATIQRYGEAGENSVLVRIPVGEGERDYAGQVVENLDERLNAGVAGKLDLNLQGRAAIADLLRDADPDNRGSSPDAAAAYDAIAEKIIDRRSELGIFTDLSQATSVEGVSPAAATLLRERAALGRFNVLSQETVGPQVGEDLRIKAIWAIILATLAMGAYIAVRFDVKFGVAGIVALVHDSALALAFMLMINAEFAIITVAAFLMIIGYSINDSVVVYDRVRENVKKLRMREDFETVLNKSLNQTLSRTMLTGGSVMLVLLALIFLGGEVIHEFALLLLVGTIAGTYSTLFLVPLVVIAWNRRASSSKSAYGAADRRGESRVGEPAAANGRKR
ncbi:MAG: protein translocase subunit SecF [Thermoanaerobaculia bacterium]